MKRHVLVDAILSSLIFAFPRRFPVKLYTSIRRFFKSKKQGDPQEGQETTNLGNLTAEEQQLEERFKRACKAVQGASSLSDKQQLTLYGLYKQALVGDCTKGRPSENDFVELKKWEAWNEQKGLTQTGAKREYIRSVEDFVPAFKAQDANTPIVPRDDEYDIFLTDDEYKRLKEGDKKQNLGMKFSRPEMGSEDMFVKAKTYHKEEDDVQRFFDLIDQENLAEIENMIHQGFDLNKQNNSGIKAIHYAIENDKNDVTKLLCQHYTDINVPDESGMTPLHFAVAHENEEIIELLLRKNADIHRKDSEGETPYDFASSKLKSFINECLAS